MHPLAISLIGPWRPAFEVKAVGADFLKYENDFATWLPKHAPAEKRDSGSGLDRVTWYYYDRALILYREALRTGSATMLTRAHKAANLYRNALPNLDPPMYWSFVQSMAIHWLITGNIKSRDAVVKFTELARAPYYMDAMDGVPVPGEDNTDDRTRARVLEHYIVAHHINAPIPPNDFGDVRPYATMAKISLDAILQSQNAQGSFSHRLKQKSPFMVGLLHEAMILYFRLVSSDPRILPAIQKSAEFLWVNHWRQASLAFVYDPGEADVGEDNLAPAPDLNMLIISGFGWLYKMTRNAVWKQRGDLILKGGVADPYLAGAKQFNQQYVFGHQYPKLIQ